MVATVGVRRFQTFIELRRHLAASNAESNEPRRHCQVEPFRPRWGATGSASCDCGRGAPLRSRI
jgi:hypothetical protein